MTIGCLVLVHLMVLTLALMVLIKSGTYFPLIFYISLNLPLYVAKKLTRFP